MRSVVMASSLRLTDLATIITRRRLLIGSLAFGLSIAVIVFVEVARPNYRAEALIEVLTATHDVPGAEGVSASQSDATEVTATVNTEAARIGSDPVLRKVYQQLGQDYVSAMRASGPMAVMCGLLPPLCPKAPRQAAPSGDPPPLTIDRDAATSDRLSFYKFRKAFTVEGIRGSRLIRISASAPDPMLAAGMANALAKTYISVKETESARQNDSYIRWLQQRMAEMDERAVHSDRAVADYRRTKNLVEMGTSSEAARRSTAVEQLATLVTELGAAKAAKAQSEIRLSQLKALQSHPEQASASGEVVGSEAVRDLYRSEAAARARLLELDSLGESHPHRVAAAKTLEDIHLQITTQVGRVLSAARQDYQRASAVVALLAKEVDQQRGIAGDEQIDRVELRELERKALVEGDVHSAFLRSTRQAIELSSLHRLNVQLAVEAASPERPDFPDKRAIIPIGWIGSFSLATMIGIAWDLRRRNWSFMQPADLEESTGKEVEGAIPLAHRLPDTPMEKEVARAVEEIGMRMTQRAIRARQSGDCKRGYIVAVTSTAQGEGKSTLSLDLARWMALNGRRTLLVDADLRRPAILPRLTGPTELTNLRGPSWAPDMRVLVDGWSNLSILPLNEIPINPIVVLDQIDEILTLMRDRFDFIIVDTPPLLAVSDALNVVHVADRTLFIVQWAVTPRSSVLYALSRIAAEERERTDLVFSKIDLKVYRHYDMPGSERYGRLRDQGYSAFGDHI